MQKYSLLQYSLFILTFPYTTYRCTIPFLFCLSLSGDLSLIIKPMTISEGERVVLTTDILMATDSGSQSVELVYTVTVPPKHGYLHMVQHPGIPLYTFTQMDVASHWVCYTHDNSHFTGHDSFRSVLLNLNIYTYKIKDLKHSCLAYQDAQGLCCPCVVFRSTHLTHFQL